ncbi:MAG TPA: NADPH-dependent FMN reductase, partial [Opitutaceae bacterium]|nr:NADPH-dependent FMN reductase [Opitutaceae bacterium]
NPDNEHPLPAVVQDLRARVQHASGVLISSPEYAHGVPGVLKNALDWLVGGIELTDKPVALFNASPRSTYAVESLNETLKIMGARLVSEAFVNVHLRGWTGDETSLVEDPAIREAVRFGLDAFRKAIAASR